MATSKKYHPPCHFVSFLQLLITVLIASTSVLQMKFANYSTSVHLSVFNDTFMNWFENRYDTSSIFYILDPLSTRISGYLCSNLVLRYQQIFSRFQTIPSWKFCSLFFFFFFLLSSERIVRYNKQKVCNLLEVIFRCVSVKARMSYHLKHIFLMLKIWSCRVC